MEHSTQLIKKAKWTLSPGLFSDPNGRDSLFQFEQWVRDGCVQVVKSGPHRTVYHVQLPDLDIHLKHNKISGLRTFLRECSRDSKAQYEFQIATRLLNLGIPTVEPLAFGVGSSFAPDSFLITKTLTEASSLEQFWGSLSDRGAGNTVRFRAKLITALAKLLASMHRKGVIHYDLHPGNLLVRQQNGEVLIYLIDLHPVRIQQSPISWKQRLINMAMLDRWATMHTSNTDRMRFWKRYEQEVKTHEGERAFPFQSREWVRRQMRLMKRREFLANLRLWKRFDHRCMGNNSRFKFFDSNECVGSRVVELTMEQLAPFLEKTDPRDAFPNGEILKHSKSSTVIRCRIENTNPPRNVIFKKITATKWIDPILNLFRPDGTTRSWKMGQALLHRKLPTPRPLAFWHKKKNFLSTDGYIITEEIPNATDLPQFLEDTFRLPDNERLALIRDLIDSLAALIRRMHDLSVSHRDLKAPNLMVTNNGLKHQIWLVDLVGVRTHFFLSGYRKEQNLARLNASFLQSPQITLTDKLRFLRQYLRWGVEGPFVWRDWWRKIEAITMRKIAKNIKSGRPLA